MEMDSLLWLADLDATSYLFEQQPASSSPNSTNSTQLWPLWPLWTSGPLAAAAGHLARISSTLQRGDSHLRSELQAQRLCSCDEPLSVQVCVMPSAPLPADGSSRAATS